jgi:hypothetical protein
MRTSFADLPDPRRRRGPAARPNRRVLYVVGAVLVIVVLALLVALMAWRPRPEHDGNVTRASQLSPAGGRWFDKIPERKMGGLPTTVGPPLTSPAPTLQASAPVHAKTLSDADIEAQRRECALRAAMAAPIAVVAFEARSLTPRGGSSERSATGIGDHRVDRSGPGSGNDPGGRGGPATCAASGRTSSGVPRSSPGEPPRAVRPYDAKAGTITPPVLLTRLNSGQLIGTCADQSSTRDGPAPTRST